MGRGKLTFYAPEFNSPWPLYGKKFNQQIEDVRSNMRTIAPLARALTLDENSNDNDDKELSGITLGELEFRSRFRTFYDRDGKFFKIQVNRGTEGCPDWRDCLTIRSSDCQVFATGLGGIKSVGGFYGGSGDFPGAAEFQQFYGVLFRDGRLALRDDELNFNPADFYLSKDSRDNLVLNNISAGGGGSGQNNTGSNVGTGAGVFKTKIGADLKFRSLVEGSNITIVESTDEITISSTAAGGGGGGGFYGITVKEDGTVIGKTDSLQFEADDFNLNLQDGDIRISLANPGGGSGTDTPGFYGIVIEESDQTNTLRDDTIRFKADEFDISEVNDKPQVALSSDIAKKSDLPLFYGITVKEDGTVVARTDSLQFEADDFDLNLQDGDVRITLANPGGGGGGGFYGIIVEESDQTNTLRDDTIRFKADDFDVSEVNDKPQVALSDEIARLSDITPGFYGIILKEDDTVIAVTDTLKFLGTDFSFITQSAEFDIATATLAPDSGNAAVNMPLTNIVDGLADTDIFDSSGFGIAVDFTPKTDNLAFTSLSTLGIANSWTISLWCNFSSGALSSAQTMLLIFQSSGNQNSILIQKSGSTNRLEIALRRFDAASSFQRFDNFLSEEQWHNITVVKHASDNSYDVYLDGSQISPTSQSAFQVPEQTDTTRDITIGGGVSGANGNFDGFIGQIAIWSAELSDVTIAEIFNKSGDADLTVDSTGYLNSADLEHYYFAYGAGEADGGTCITLDDSARCRFYGVNVGQTNDNPLYKGISTVKFHEDNFYVTQNAPNTDEVIVNLRGLNFQLTFAHSDGTQTIAADEIRFNVNDFYLTETSQGFPMLNLRDGGGGVASVVQQGSRDGTAQEWDVRDDLDEMETLEDQNGAGAVLTYTFNADVHMVILENTSSTLAARATINNSETPSATKGVRVLDSPIYIPGITDTVKVFAPVGTTISVSGLRRS